MIHHDWKSTQEPPAGPPPAERSRRASARLASWCAIFAAVVFALIPLIIDPDDIILYVPAAFAPPKFELFMKLSAALLVVVFGATLSGVRPAKVPVLLPVLTFFGVSTLSAIFSTATARALIGAEYRHDGLLSLAAGVLLFYAAARFLDSWTKVRAFLAAGAVSAVVVSLYGISQHLGLDPLAVWAASRGIPWDDGTLRAFSTIGNPLFLAAYLTLALGVTASLYFSSRYRWERFVWLCAMVLMSACWLYTYSRGAVLGVTLALLVLVWVSYRNMRTVRPLLLPAALLVVSIIVASQIGGTGVSQRVTAVEGESALSAMTRLYIWRDTVPMILERPILGHGPDNFAEPFKQYEGEDLKAAAFNLDRGASDTVDKAHNELLQIAATTGLLGLTTYLWVLVSYFRNAYRSGSWPIIALSGGVLAYILQLQTAFSTVATGVTFWAILGVSVAIVRLQEQETAVVLPVRSEAAGTAQKDTPPGDRSQGSMR